MESRRLLAVSVADLIVNEGDGTAQVVITNTPTSSTPITFDAATAGNTATGNADYQIRFAPLTIPANQPSVTFDVGILEDFIPESSEQFFINITNVVGTTVADSRATVTILDNDSGGGAVEFSVADVTVDEGDGTADITVSLSQAATSTVTVLASTTNGTAGPNDITANTQTLNFNPGVTEQVFSVTINDDSIEESDEGFFVSLSTPSSGATITDGNAVVTIRDNDGTSSATGELVGVDFDAGGASPNNWTTAGLSGTFLANLIDETGSPTGINLLVVGATQGSNQGGQDPSVSPTHDNPLTGLAGNLASTNGPLFFTYSGLNPGAEYEVFVFAGTSTSVQGVTITGSNTVGPFTQNSPSGAMSVNDQLATSAPLSSFAELVVADSSGEILIQVSQLSSGFSQVNGLAIRETIAPPPVAEFVGVDFGPDGNNSPVNWTASGSQNTDFTLTDLIDESGTATAFDLSVAFDGGAGPGVFTRDALAELPTHSNPLNGVGDILVDQVSTTFTFSDLTPGVEYEVYVFGGTVVSARSQDVTITGGNTVSFTQDWTNNVFVNRVPSSTAPLESFAERITASVAGEIVITVTESADIDFAVVAALAIREVVAPPVDELVGVDFGPFGTSSPANWTVPGSLNTDFTLTNLIDESGSPTAFDLGVAFNGGSGIGPITRNDPAELPTHSNPLNGVGDIIVDDVSTTFTFSDLTPGVEYELYVFGGDPNNAFSQDITIVGGNTVSFTQDWTNNVFVNRVPSSTTPLDSFAERVTASFAGEIVITVTESVVGDFVVVNALAIREIQTADPLLPTISIVGQFLGEQSGTIDAIVRLSAPVSEVVGASVVTANGSATGGQDFVPIDQNIVFLPGDTEVLVPITILDDDDVEPSEEFFLQVTAAFGANVGLRGSFTISDLEFRTIDGTLNQPDDKGAAETPVIRFGYPHGYVDGIGDEISELKTAVLTTNPSFVLPNARDVSNAVFSQAETVENARNLSDWIVQWGQFVTHDMNLTTNGAEFNTLSTGAVGDFNIPVLDPSDPLGPGPIPFNRSQFDPTTGNATPLPNGEDNSREQINQITSFIDASNVYGSDPSREAELRSFSGGKLKVSAGDLPHLNTALFPNDNNSSLPDSQLFLGGDARANEQIGLTAAHTLFLREHNRLAEIIAAQNPTLNDEQIYQWARRIVGAQMQIITYEEYLPALMGDLAPDPNAVVDRDVDPSITNSFANAFFRFGHTMQSSELQLVDNDGNNVNSMSLRDIFFRPDLIKSDPTLIDLTVKGLASQAAQENDVLLVDDIRNFLFGHPGAGGLDLGALDLQRGRDHGLLAFNELRLNYQLPRLNSFSELTSDPVLAAELQAIYGDINHVEAFVGAIAEDHESGTSIGSMLVASLTDQFERLRDGDQFFYTVDPGLQDPIVTGAINLSNFTLADVIRNNTAVTEIQDNVFFASGTISGTKWLDADGNGEFDSGESPLAGVTIFLDVNGNDVLDHGEASAVTDVHGNYEIEGVLPGVHRVVEVVPVGFSQTFPVTGGEIFLAEATADEIVTLDVSTGVITNRVASPVPIPIDFGVATLGANVFVGGGSSDPIVLINPVTGLTVRSIPNPGIDVSGLAVIGNELFVQSDSPAEIQVIDLGTDTVVRTFSTVSLREGIGSDGSRLLGLSGNGVFEIDLIDGTTTELFTLSNIDALMEGLGVLGDQLYISTFNAVHVFGLATGSFIRTIDGLTNLEGIGADNNTPVLAGPHLVNLQTGENATEVNFGNQIDAGSQFDFGDAPAPYPTTLTDGGAFHTPVGPTLGSNRDSESDGQPTVTADGDDDNGDNDEDGVLFGGITPGGDSAALNVDLQNAADALVDVWIDFNRDGDWNDPGEQILSNQPVAGGLQTINYDVPSGVTAGTTFARVRVSSNGGLSPGGFSVDGEVEDYQITIGSPRVESVVINDGDAQRSSLDSIRVTFDREVTFVGEVADAFQVVNESTGVATPVQATVTIDPINDRTVVDLTFVPDGPSDPLITSLGSLTDGDYRMVVLSSMVNASGVGLEEDFVFGDGELADVLFRKYGDDSGDDSVGLTDFAAFRSTFGLDFGDPKYLRGLDANGDNTIGLTDFAAFRTAFGN